MERSREQQRLLKTSMTRLLKTLRQVERLIAWASTGKNPASDSVELSMIHEGLLFAYGELDSQGNVKRSTQHSERGLYRLVTGAMKELSEMNIPSCVDLTSVSQAVKTWKDSYFVKALEHFDTIEELKENIPYCFSCFSHAPLEVAHIVSRGAEPRLIESVDNLMLFCHKCHIQTQHQNGWSRLIQQSPHLWPRIERARSLISESLLQE